MFCQPMRGLIDAHHQRIRMRFCNDRGAHASATERIEDQRPVITLQPLEQLLECLTGMCRAGFAPWVILVVLHSLC
jgi:hypothetical protein